MQQNKKVYFFFLQVRFWWLKKNNRKRERKRGEIFTIQVLQINLHHITFQLEKHAHINELTIG